MSDCRVVYLRHFVTWISHVFVQLFLDVDDSEFRHCLRDGVAWICFLLVSCSVARGDGLGDREVVLSMIYTAFFARGIAVFVIDGNSPCRYICSYK